MATLNGIFPRLNPHPPTAMSLVDLVQHTPVQTNAINTFLPKHSLRVSPSWPNLHPWDAFRDSVWKKGLSSFQTQEPVERGENPAGHLESLPRTRSVTNIPDVPLCTLGSGWANRRILVLPEYQEAERADLSAFEDLINIFAVTGQHGIGAPVFHSTTMTPTVRPGKTMFLLWLLSAHGASRAWTPYHAATRQWLPSPLPRRRRLPAFVPRSHIGLHNLEFHTPRKNPGSHRLEQIHRSACKSITEQSVLRR